MERLFLYLCHVKVNVMMLSYNTFNMLCPSTCAQAFMIVIFIYVCLMTNFAIETIEL